MKSTLDRQQHCKDAVATTQTNAGLWKSILLAAAIVVGSFIVFRGLLRLPYVGDDWAILRKMAFMTPRQIMLLSIDTSLLQIRPLQYMYTWAFLARSGTYSCAFHSAALIAHMCNALLLVFLMRLITKSATIGWIIGGLYAIAVNIHLVPQMWLVGSSDILGPFFFFLSFAFLVKRRSIPSAIAFLVALLFKEFAAALLSVMLLYVVMEDRQKRGTWGAIVNGAKRLAVHITIALPFMIYKMLFLPSPMKLPPDHPYKLALTGPHVIKNGFFYGLWLVQSLVPFEISAPRKLMRALAAGSTQDLLFVALFLCALVALCVVAILARKHRRLPKEASDTNEKQLYSLLLFWSIMGIAPVYFLPNHVIAYYMTYSLPPLLAIILLCARSLARRIGLRRREMIGIAAVFLVLQFLWSAAYITRLNDRHYYMLAGARQVMAVHRYLMEHYPKVAPNTSFIIQGDDITMWAIRDDKAVQCWYHDRSLKVYDARFVRMQSDRLLAVKPPKEIMFPGSRVEGETAIAGGPVVCLRITPDYRVVGSTASGVVRASD